jgi:hypothetical protein
MEMEKGAIGSHKSNTWYTSRRVPQVGWRWRKVLSGPTSRTHDMQAIGSHRSDGDGERCRWVPQVGWRRVHKHKWHASGQVPQVGWRKAPQVQVTRKPSGPTGRIEKGPTGTCCMEKGSSGDFYDELQASWMSNCRSHKFITVLNEIITNEQEQSREWSMMKPYDVLWHFCDDTRFHHR